MRQDILIKCGCGAEERLQMRDHFVELGQSMTWGCSGCRKATKHKVISCSPPRWTDIP